jgi:hypothetical protein
MLSLCCAAHTLPCHAQEPRTADGVRAAINAILTKRPVKDSLRLAADSASAWRDFVRCRDVSGRTVCALVDGKPVSVVEVRLTAPDSADVVIRQFRMVYERCPGGDRIDPPVISTGVVGAEWWTFTYSSGGRHGVRSDEVMTC